MSIPIYVNLPFYETFKGVSDLKTHLDYCEDPTRSCKNSNSYFPAQTELFD